VIVNWAPTQPGGIPVGLAPLVMTAVDVVVDGLADELPVGEPVGAELG
jgi:hypothetical protein